MVALCIAYNHVYITLFSTSVVNIMNRVNQWRAIFYCSRAIESSQTCLGHRPVVTNKSLIVSRTIYFIL